MLIFLERGKYRGFKSVYGETYLYSENTLTGVNITVVGILDTLNKAYNDLRDQPI